MLRWWRSDVLGLTQHQAAERLNVQPSSLSNWERGTRAISLDTVEVDRALDGESVLGGILWAFGTPRGLEPGRMWTKVYPGPSHAVWVWIRAESSTVELVGEWGLARVATELDLGPNGAFLTLGASVPDSPIVLRFNEPAWADFGVGPFPSNVPAASVVDAVHIFEASSADGEFMDLFRTSVAEKLARRSLDVVAWAQRVPRSVASFMSGLGGQKSSGERVIDLRTEGITAIERRRFAALRRARQLSLMQVSDRLSRYAQLETSRDTLRRFETDVGRPHDPMLPVALDHVLGAEGRLVVHELRARSGVGSVTFPRYWRGPVWLEISAPGPRSISLERGNWCRTVEVDGSASLSVHWFEPTVPLRIAAPDDVGWSVGIGLRADAISIDHNWAPVDVGVAKRAVSEIEDAIQAALDRSDHEDG